MEEFAPHIIFWVRVFLLPIAVFNLSWSWTGMRDNLTGKHWPVATHRTFVFWVSFATIGFCMTYFLVGMKIERSPWILLWLLALMCGQLFATAGRLFGHLSLGEKFYWLITSGHLKVALVMANYHAVEPEKAEELAHEIRMKTAETMAREALDG